MRRLFILLIIMLFVSTLSIGTVSADPPDPGNGDTLTDWEESAWEKETEILDSIQEPTIPDRDYVITDFGAVGDGTADARPAILAAIEKANAEGGGRVVLPEGTWFSKGPIHLKSNVNLHVSEDALLLFSEDPDDYLPQVFQRWEGVEIYNYSPLIYAYDVENVAITGHGVIDGNAENGFGTWRPKQKRSKVHEMGAEQVPVKERVFGEEDYIRPSMIQIMEAENLLIEDVTIKESPFWIVHPTYSNNIIVRDLTIKSFRLNNDGIDIDSCTNVLIENNDIHTGDDAIVVKSGRDQDAWRVDRPSENIIIRNNTMRGHNALAIGSEMSGGVQTVLMYDNDLADVKNGIYFKSNPDRGGYIKNVWVRDIHVEEAERLLRFDTNYHAYRGEYHPTLYQNFIIENVTAHKAEKGIEAIGLDDLPIKNVLVRNFHLENADTPLDISNVSNFIFEDVKINGIQIEPYFSSVDIEGDMVVGNTVEGVYDYIGGKESELAYKWLIADEEDGQYEPIDGADSDKYTLKSSDSEQFIKFQVNNENGLVEESPPYAVQGEFDGDLSITSPDNQSTVKNHVQVAVEVTTEEPVDRVELYVNDTLIASQPAKTDDGIYEFNWNTYELPNGEYELAAQVWTQNDQQRAMSDPVTVIVNNYFQSAELTDDTWVSENDADTNYGNDREMSIKNDPRSPEKLRHRIGYVQFDISQIENVDQIQSANFAAFGRTQTAEESSNYDGKTPLSIAVHELENLSAEWDEETLTWNNKPELGSILSTNWVHPAPQEDAQWYHWDVTDAVINALNNDQDTVTLAVWSDVPYVETMAKFVTKEGAARDPFGSSTAPQLKIIFDEPKDITVSSIKQRIKEYEESGEFENFKDARFLQTHLTTVGHYESEGLMDKAIKYMNSFKQLLDYQKDTRLLSEKAYNALYFDAESLLRKWQ